MSKEKDNRSSRSSKKQEKIGFQKPKAKWEQQLEEPDFSWIPKYTKETVNSYEEIESQIRDQFTSQRNSEIALSLNVQVSTRLRKKWLSLSKLYAPGLNFEQAMLKFIQKWERKGYSTYLVEKLSTINCINLAIVFLSGWGLPHIDELMRDSHSYWFGKYRNNKKKTGQVYRRLMMNLLSTSKVLEHKWIQNLFSRMNTITVPNAQSGKMVDVQEIRESCPDIDETSWTTTPMTKAAEAMGKISAKMNLYKTGINMASTIKNGFEWVKQRIHALIKGAETFFEEHGLPTILLGIMSAAVIVYVIYHCLKGPTKDFSLQAVDEYYKIKKNIYKNEESKMKN